MRKGHRRTQSDTIHTSQRTIHQPQPQPNTVLTHLEITKLLTLSNQKVKQKISNVEILAPLVQNEQIYFQFGHNSRKRLNHFNENQNEGDYLASIPQKKQSFHRQGSQRNIHLHKKLERKQQMIESVLEEKVKRLPFSDAQNSRLKDRKKFQVQKLGQQKKGVKKNLGLKMKF